MNLFGVMDISASALRAERVRAEVVAANMANAETTRTADGSPYRRQQVVFAQAGGDGFADSLLAQRPMLTNANPIAGNALGISVPLGGVQVAGIVAD